MLKYRGAGAGTYVRILVKTGGCAGMTYDAELDADKNEDEVVVMSEGGLVVISNKQSLGYLEGLQIDYSDDLISAGFRFNNSRNESSCGCGASFSRVGFPEIFKGGASCEK